MIWELTGGKGWLIMLSWVSYLRSIMVTRYWMWYIYCVCLGQTYYLRQALTNGCIAAIVMIWELTGGKGWLIMLSWISYLRSIMDTRDWLWYIFCVCLGQTYYLRQALTNGWIAAIVMIWELTGGKGWLIMLSWISYQRSIMITRDWMWYI